MANIPISSLPEVTTIAEDDYLAVDNGTTSSKIKVSKFNEESTTSAYTYMTRAETAASNASDSAAAALGYKNEVSNLITSAQTVVSDAQTYASNAQTSAGAASSSATTASNKATAAANSANQAASYAANVDSFAKEAKSWARGGTGTRVGEDTDNSMYYANEAKASEIAAASSESNAASSESNAATSESNASSSASSASTNALKAEGYAVGSQNGTPAISGETYYHDNAKYYKEEAATSATNASTSETNAGLSESAASSSASSAKDSKEDSEAWAVGKRNGVDVPSTDETYQNNAKYWAGVAAGAAGGGVTTFNGRSGVVTSAAHDYNAGQVDYSNTTSGLSATDVQGAIDEIKGGLGTAAALNVAASGDAATTEVVKGDDSRLTDARTPVSHTHTKSEITDFPTLGTAAAKNSTNAVTQNSTDLVESGAVYTGLDGKSDKPTLLTSTLAAGSTTLTFTNAAIGNNSRIKYYSNPFVVGLIEDAVQSGTTVTLTCAEQASAVDVMLEVSN